VYFAQPCPAFGAGQLDTALEVLDSNVAAVKVYVLYTKGKCLRDAAAQMEKEPYEQPIPKAGGCIFHQFYVFRLKIRLHGSIFGLSRHPAGGFYIFLV